LIAYSHSIDPVVENAQHEPQSPWFLTGVTTPAVTQLTDAGAGTCGVSTNFFGLLLLIF